MTRPIDRILLSAPDVGELEEQYVLSALRSGWVAPMGPDVGAFEREMSEHVGVDHAVAVSSGTAALHLALLALEVGPGDVVVTSTLTFAATANAIAYTGAAPFFVDCDSNSGNMDPELLAHSLRSLSIRRERVAAVVPVDLLGKCADYDRIEKVCSDYGVPVVSDAAEALGAVFGDRSAGSLGVAAALSFNGNKVMTTSGGGMLLTDDASIASRARHLATQARQPVAHYQHEDIGYNYRLSNLLAALGRAQLRRLHSMLGRRRALRERYRALIEGVEGVRILGGDNDNADNCWLTALIVDPIAGFDAQDFGAALAEAGIETRPMWKPMHQQPAFRRAGAFTTGAADRIFDHGLVLPSGSALTQDEVEYIMGTMHHFLAN